MKSQFFRVSPEFFESEEQFHDLISRFEPKTKLRYMLGDHDEWLQAALSHAEYLSPLAKARLVERLNRFVPDGLYPTLLDEQLMVAARLSLESKKVLPECIEADEYLPVSGVLESCYDRSKEFAEFKLGLDMDKPAVDGFGILPDELVVALTPIALKAPLLVIVDPYLNINDKHTRSFLKSLIGVGKFGCLERADIYVRHVTAVENVSREGISLLEGLTKLQESIPNSIKVRLNLFRDRGETRLHSRSVFSRWGGFALDQGAPSKKNIRGERSFNVLGEQSLAHLKDIFINGRNDLEIVERYEVPNLS